MNRNFLLSLVFALTVIGACAPSRFVQPLEKGQQCIGLNFGGPVIEFSGMLIPTPLSAIYYGYGFNEKTTFFGALHLTSLAYGNIQTDLGATYRLFDQKGLVPALSISPVLNFVSHFSTGATHVWPEFDANAYWSFGGHKSYFYVGMANWFEPAGKRVHDEKSIDRWLLNPHAGVVFRTSAWDYTLELKLLGLSHKNDYVFVPYRSLTGTRGATGLFLGASFRF